MPVRIMIVYRTGFTRNDYTYYHTQKSSLYFTYTITGTIAHYHPLTIVTLYSHVYYIDCLIRNVSLLCMDVNELYTLLPFMCRYFGNATTPLIHSP